MLKVKCKELVCQQQKTLRKNAMKLVSELNSQIFQRDSAFWGLVYTLCKCVLMHQTKFLL